MSSSDIGHICVCLCVLSSASSYTQSHELEKSSALPTRKAFRNRVSALFAFPAKVHTKKKLASTVDVYGVAFKAN